METSTFLDLHVARRPGTMPHGYWGMPVLGSQGKNDAEAFYANCLASQEQEDYSRYCNTQLRIPPFLRAVTQYPYCTEMLQT